MEINWDSKEKKWMERKEIGEKTKKRGKMAKKWGTWGFLGIINQINGRKERNWGKIKEERKIGKNGGKGKGGMRVKRQRNEGKCKRMDKKWETKGGKTKEWGKSKEM